MTPELRELLKRHPAPWGRGRCVVMDFERGIEATEFVDAVVDANGKPVDGLSMACIVALVNAAAADRDAWEID